MSLWGHPVTTSWNMLQQPKKMIQTMLSKFCMTLSNIHVIFQTNGSHHRSDCLSVSGGIPFPNSSFIIFWHQAGKSRAVNECPAWCDDGNILNLKASFCSLPIARIGYKSNYSIPTSFLWIPIHQRRPPPMPQLDFLCCKFNIKMRNSCSVPKWFKESDIEWISSSNLPRVVPLGRPSSFLWIKRRTWWTQNRTEEEFN